MSTKQPPQMDPAFFDVIDATWPAIRYQTHGAMMLRQGGGGGSRVSCATAAADVSDADLDYADNWMRDQGQPSVFMVRDGQNNLDQVLERRGLVVKDPTVLRVADVSRLADIKIPRVTTFCTWPALAIQRTLWAEGGIGPQRLAIMERAAGPKTALFGRMDDQPAATGFVAIHNGIAMLHALEVHPDRRRKGMARWMMHQAAQWAQLQGATRLAILVTKANFGANALYQGLGMECAGQYHYRVTSTQPVDPC